MTNRSYNIIGVMSGTSLDGIDLIFASIVSGKWSYNILKSETISYTVTWQDKLKEAVNFSSEKLQVLDDNYTNLLADIILKFIKNNSINNLDAVCSHGHTILHQPEKGITYQIGNRPELAALIGRKVVCDFRAQDVDFGGQGAPLVPIGDRLLFGDYEYCLNLGGFANVSFERNEKRIAFDICPVNIVMNHYCKQINLDYDDNGHLASKGTLNQDLYNDLNELSYYKKEPPKSLGLEWVEVQIFPLIESYQLSIEDFLRTFVEHVAIQIAKSINGTEGMLVTGGGTYNGFLISRIKALSHNNIVIPSKEIIEYKEALVFGLLGVLRMRNEVNCLSSVTGASQDHSSGKIFIP